MSALPHRLVTSQRGTQVAGVQILTLLLLTVGKSLHCCGPTSLPKYGCLAPQNYVGDLRDAKAWSTLSSPGDLDRGSNLDPTDATHLLPEHKKGTRC